MSRLLFSQFFKTYTLHALVDNMCDCGSLVKYTSVDHVIFDLDGLLLGTEEIYFKMFSMMCAQYDKKYTNDIREKVLGSVEKDSCSTIIKELSLPVTTEEFIDHLHVIQEEMLPFTPLMPGAETLVCHLNKHGVPMAVATSSAQESIDLKLRNHQDLFSLFDHITSASSDPDVKKGKPAPDVFLACASRFPNKPKPEKCLVFEDAPNGVQAAKAAGMQVVMVPDKYISEENRKLATMVLESLEEFKPEIFGLPPF